MTVVMKYLISYLAIILATVAVTLACNGYTLTFQGVENCAPDNNIFVHDGFTVTMDENCDIAPTGCVDIKKPFSKAVGMYKITKPPLPPIQGNVDFCEAMEKYAEYFDVILEMFGVPKRCPYEAANFCLDGKKAINLGPMKSKLSMAVGNIELFINSTMDDTMVTCVRAKLKIEKPKKGKSG